MTPSSYRDRAAATVALLWRDERDADVPRRRRSGLTVDAVVDAAIGLADRDGLDALTMRRVASALGVSSMTPYGYVPGKAGLLDLMVDTVYQRMRVTTVPGAPWRERVTSVARDNRVLHRSHPWTLGLPLTRPPLGPGLLAKYERELAAFDGLRLTDLEIDAALAHLLALVRTAVQAEIDAERTARDSGVDDRGWWDVVGPLLARVASEERYPLAARVGTAAGRAHGRAHDAGVVYRFGLARFLDGLEVLVAGRTA